MKSTREKILQTLLKYPRSSINELAQSVDINAISVRHHLTNLQAEGLVNAEEERHGVGRPRLVYSLTETGVEQFPTGYLNFTNRLLENLKTTLSADDIEMIFSKIAKGIAADHASDLTFMPIEEKLERIKEILSAEGYSIEWRKNDEQYLIDEISCPYYHIGRKHPEICLIDKMIIANLLSLPVKQINCLLSGDSRCTFLIDTTEV